MVKLSSVTGRTLISLAALNALSIVTAYVSLWQPQFSNEATATARVIQLKHADDSTGNLLATFEYWYCALPGNQSNKTASNFII